MTPFVVAVSGPPGSGKSALVRTLARRLPAASVVEYDAHEEATRWSDGELARWIAAGAPFDDIPTPGLAAALDRAIAHQAGRPEAEEGAREGAGVVLFDTLLGRAHAATGPRIDHLVWLDTPLDLCLARKIGAFLAESPAGRNAEFGRFLSGYLHRYPVVMAPLYAAQRARVRPAADTIADTILPAVLPPESFAEDLAARIRRRWRTAV